MPAEFGVSGAAREVAEDAGTRVGFLVAMGDEVRHLAVILRIPVGRIEAVVDLRLGVLLGAARQLDRLRRIRRLGRRIDRIGPFRQIRGHGRRCQQSQDGKRSKRPHRRFSPRVCCRVVMFSFWRSRTAREPALILAETRGCLPEPWRRGPSKAIWPGRAPAICNKTSEAALSSAPWTSDRPRSRPCPRRRAFAPRPSSAAPIRRCGCRS